MPYHDLNVRFLRTQAGPNSVFRIAVDAGRFGEGSGTFTPPRPWLESTGFETTLRALEREVVRSAGPRELDIGGQDTRSAAVDVRELGTALYQSLFAGEAAQPLHQARGANAVVHAIDGGLDVRYRFVFDRETADLTDLSAIPWEAIYFPGRSTFAARSRRSPIVRTITTPEPIQPIPIGEGLRVLMIESSPEDARELGTPVEAERLKAALREVPGSQVVHLREPHPEDLHRELVSQPFHVVHFMGHGGFDANGAAVILFEKRNRTSYRLPAASFAEYVKECPSVRLVVLNACSTAELPRHRGRAPYSVAAAELVRRGIPAVVAMQFPISDPAAIAFSEGFYRAVARLDELDAAVADGRLAICREHEERTNGADGETLEWLTPVFYLQGDDARLFVPEEQGRGSRAEASSPHPVRLGIRSREGLAIGLENAADDVLNLVSYFDDRKLRPGVSWDTDVIPELRRFLRQAMEAGRPLTLDLACHQSLAFLVGSVLEPKSGIEIGVVQRTPDPEIWFPRPADELRLEVFGAPEELPVAPNDKTSTPVTADLAVAASVTWNIAQQVEEYLRGNGPAVRRALHLEILGGASRTSVTGGSHALRLAQVLGREMRKRTGEEWEGTLHFFASVPNALMVFLGQLAPALGTIQLYEYEFEATGPERTYWPSFRLPRK